MQPITGVDVNPAKDPTQVRGLYPSLLDPNSPSLTYETIEGDTAYVYWVQGRDKTVVGAPDMARDLWRQKVEISFNDTFLDNPPPTPPASNWDIAWAITDYTADVFTAGLDEGLLSLPLSNLLSMENPDSHKKCQ